MKTAEYMSANDLEALTGTKASTWRYFAHTNQGPPSLKIGRRRVWKRDVVLEWLDAQADADPARD